MKIINLNTNKQIILKLEPKSNVIAILKKLAQNKNIGFATVKGIGAISKAKISVYNIIKKEYKVNDFEMSDGYVYEVLSFEGNIAWNIENNEPIVHIHITFSDLNGNVYGGHLWECVSEVTFELIITYQENKRVYRTLDNYSKRYLL